MCIYIRPAHDDLQALLKWYNGLTRFQPLARRIFPFRRKHFVAVVLLACGHDVRKLRLGLLFVIFNRRDRNHIMTKSFVNEWVKLIRPLFPKNTRIEINAEYDVILRIDWKLRNDPARPNKRSRLIRVIIREKAIADCTDFKKAGSRFKKIIEDKLSVFHPDHDTRRCGTPPKEKWIISTLGVN